jgi:glutathione S-transferase
LNRFCPFVQRTWIALEEKGIDYYYEEINPYHKDESYLAINPKGLVPSLRRNGKSLAESDVLVEYLEDAFPGTKPLFSRESAEDKALTRMTIDLIAKKIVPASFKTLQTQDEEGQKKARKEYVDGVKEFASRIKEGQTYHGGKDIDAADVSLAPWATREYLMEEHRGGPFTEEEVGSKYMAWKKAMLSRPSIINTMSEKDKYAPIYGRYLRDEAQSDAAKATRGGRVIP